jgi:hypothetical protein
VLSNEPAVAASYPYRDVEVAPFDNSYIVNRARFTPMKPHDPVSNSDKTSQQTASSLASIRRYGEHVDPAEEMLPVTSDARALAVAQQHVARNAFPQQRLVGVKLGDGYDEDGTIWRALLEFDLEDNVTIEKHHSDPTLGKLIQRCRIKGVEHTVERTSWETTWQLAPEHV